jgi:hypothetical protein
MTTTGITGNLRQLMQGPDQQQWSKAKHEEIHRLVTQTKAMHFISPEQVPKHKIPTYYNEVPQLKTDSQGNLKYRIRGSIGGDRVEYAGDRYAPVAELATTKLLLNAVISTNSTWLTVDLTDFYLQTDLQEYEYAKINRRQLTSQTISEYNLQESFDASDNIYIEITKCIYGLPQAGKLSYDKLKKLLSKHGYHETTTTCLFSHEKLNIQFVLVVDDFGIKADSTTTATHLINCLQEEYNMTIDWHGKSFLGMTIDIVHAAQDSTCTISMPNYYANMLSEMKVIHTQYIHSPLLYIPPSYGTVQSQAERVD